MRLRHVPVGRAVLVMLLAIALTGVAAPASASTDAAPAPGAQALAAGLRPGAEGGHCEGSFEIAVDDGGACTHGPDPAPAGVDVSRPWQRPVTGAAAADPGPVVPCYGDGTSGPRVQAVYARASGTANRYAAALPHVRRWAAAVGSVVAASAAETGGVRHVRWVTDASCSLDVLNLELSPAGAATIAGTIAELRNLGHDRSDRKYLVWMDATVYCGIAEQYLDDRPGADNANNGHPRVPGMVARVDSGCWGIAGHSVEAHELLHTLGGVQDSAPHATPYGHCSDESDLMCYSDGPGVVMQQVCPATHENRFDCGADDYFSTAPAPGSYLDTHWNTARNAFLAPFDLALAASSGVSDPDERVTFTATLRGAGAVPTGTVRFEADGAPLGTATFDRSGRAILSTTALPAGSSRVTATSAGDSSYPSTTSPAVVHQVRSPATVALASGANPSRRGEPVHLTAAVSGASSVPAGDVSFLDGSVVLGVVPLGADGRATLTVPAPAVGRHRLTARYAGSATHVAGTSAVLEQVVQDGTSLALQSAPSPSATGQAVTLTASVSSAGGAPSGHVTFTDGDSLIGTAGVDETGRAVLSTTALGAGAHRLGARYGGDGVFLPSTAAPVEHVVRAPEPARRSGYYMVGAAGHVYAFGDARHLGDATPALGTAVAVDIEPTATGDGYWVVDDRGRVFAFGDARHLGNADLRGLTTGERVSSLSATPAGLGYWLFTSRGRVLPFGDARFLGDMAAVPLNGPVLDSIPTPTGAGYYMVASDGGIFAFGDARFAGSMGGRRLNSPVQSLVPDADGTGYWLVAGDGGVFAFDAPFRGSMGGVRLNRPVTGMVRYGDGYLMVGEDGGIFNFSDRPFAGSLGARPPAHPVVSVAAVER